MGHGAWGIVHWELGIGNWELGIGKLFSLPPAPLPPASLHPYTPNPLFQPIKTRGCTEEIEQNS
ncbi:hypothetical protein CV014_08925 [Nostoc sp. CMAA1605]|nr:hypothetical protein [Nostoc sp. CMAA1605]